MKKWGIGIEHEMRIRFSNFYMEENKYIFIDSNTLLYYFRMYEVIIMDNNKDYYTTEEDNIYCKSVERKKNLLELAKKKKPFPFNENYNSNDLNYYLMIYSLYNAPLLFFHYIFNNKEHINLKEFINDDKNNNKNLENNLQKLYNGESEKKIYSYLKILFEKKNIVNFTINFDSNELSQNIVFNYGDSGISFEEFINNINLHLNITRNIFDNKLIFDNIGLNKFYKNLYILYNNNIPHIDSTSQTKAIEFKTINYENINYEKVLDDLIQLEKTFFYVINHLPIFENSIKKFGDLVYHNIGSVKDTISLINIIDMNYVIIPEDYTGSYHIWITAPYKDNEPFDIFINNHVHLANKLQLLEPILAAHYSSPSYNAFEENESESSLRQFLNEYSNNGTSDITLMYGKKNYNINYYYLSENDILNDRKFYPINKYQSPVYDKNGNTIIYYNKLMTRRITNNIFKSIDEGDSESSDVNIQNYFSLLFEKTKIRYKKPEFHLGADIRTRNLNDFIYPLSNHWIPCLLMKKNKLMEVYYNKKLNKISYERIYNEDDVKERMKNRIGIEFRIFDHFPTNYLNQIMAILVPIVLDSIKNEKKLLFKNTYIAHQFWHNEMFNVITKGYDYTAGTKYLNTLEKEFNIKFSSKKNMHTSLILEELYNKTSKNHKGPLYNKMKYHHHINFINFNKKAWIEIINIFFKKRPKLLEKILYLNKDISNTEMINMIGKKNSYNLSKIKNYLNIYGNTKFLYNS